jgi:hypothetical protein
MKGLLITYFSKTKEHGLAPSLWSRAGLVAIKKLINVDTVNEGR